MTDERAERIVSALENIVSALENIAFSLSEDGRIADQLYAIREILEELAPVDRPGRRYLRTMDVG